MALLAKLQRYNRRHYTMSLLGIILSFAIIGQIQWLSLLFMLSIPVFVFFRWIFCQQRYHGVTDREIEQLFMTFLSGALLMLVLSIGLELAVVPFLTSLFRFGQSTSIPTQLQNYFLTENDQVAPAHELEPEKIPIKNLHADPTAGHVFIVFASILLVAVTEEVLTYWVVQGTCCCRASRRGNCLHRIGCWCKRKRDSVPAFYVLKQRQQRHGSLWGMRCHPSRLLFYPRPHGSHAFVVFLAVVAAALGLSVMKTIVITLDVSTFSNQIKTVIWRNIVHVPFQCTCGGITGVRMAERLLAHCFGGSKETGMDAATADLGRWSTKVAVVYPAVLIHTTFAVQQFVVATLATDSTDRTDQTVYHAVLSTIGNSIVLIPSFVYLRRKLHAMESNMNETHYMHVAVDWESGERRKAVNSDFGDDVHFFGTDDNSDDENASLVQMGIKEEQNLDI